MPNISVRLSALLWSLLTLVAAGLLVRNILAIAVLAPLDPNEGWNAAHALSFLTGSPLYPFPGSLMVNNYPPLSFYAVASLTRLTGDAVIAGRILSLLAFLLVCAAIAQILRHMDCGARALMCAVTIFAAALLIGSDYVAMADPQLLGHAVQLSGLVLLLRGRHLAAAALFTVSLFVKHNLVALPVAALFWLLLRNRHAGWRGFLCALAVMGLGLALFDWFYGFSLLPRLSSARLVSLANMQLAISRLWWAALPLGLLAIARHPWRIFCAAYATSALTFGLLFSAGDGVDTNAFFDLAIACALIVGLEIQRQRQSLPGAVCALPLLVFLALNFHDNNFFFTSAFRVQSASDIAFLKARPGAALCDQLSLCLWAGKGAQVDVFNIGEQIKTGARDPASLAAMIASRRFAVIQLVDLDAMGPMVHAAIARNYRLDHTNDNGHFLVPVRRAP